MDNPTDIQEHFERCRAINRELDRLGWSSDTAPPGTSCLDAFPTTQGGIVVISDPQEETAFYSEPLYRALKDLEPPVSYDDIWHAMLPHLVEEK